MIIFCFGFSAFAADADIEADKYFAALAAGCRTDGTLVTIKR